MTKSDASYYTNFDSSFGKPKLRSASANTFILEGKTKWKRRLDANHVGSGTREEEVGRGY